MASQSRTGRGGNGTGGPMDAAPARPVVVGYDGSARSVAAVDWAAAHAQHHGAALTVLFARDYPGYPAGAVGGRRRPRRPPWCPRRPRPPTRERTGPGPGRRARGQRGAGLRRPVLGAGRSLRGGAAAGPRRPWSGAAAPGSSWGPWPARCAPTRTARWSSSGRGTSCGRGPSCRWSPGWTTPRRPQRPCGSRPTSPGSTTRRWSSWSIWRAPAEAALGQARGRCRHTRGGPAEGHRGRGPWPGRAAATASTPD